MSSLTDDLLPCVEIETGHAPCAAVVWLHGLGADGHDFEPIVPELGLDRLPSIRFVFPHAPMRTVTLNLGARMRAWYDIREIDLRAGVDEPGIRTSVAMVTRLLEREKQRGIAPQHTVLAGFSQGGAVAAFTGLRHPERLAGILMLSAYLPLLDRLPAEASEANRETPILQCHGAYDPLVPPALGHHTARTLGALGYPVDWRTYPVQHGVHPQEVQDVGEWLGQVLG